jgi:hypothetical protein
VLDFETGMNLSRIKRIIDGRLAELKLSQDDELSGHLLSSAVSEQGWVFITIDGTTAGGMYAPKHQFSTVYDELIRKNMPAV